MKQTLIPIFLMICLLTACRQKPGTASSSESLAVIDVESAISSLQEELKLSDLASEVRYVPLETNDSCLIGRYPIVKICGDKLVVASSVVDNCLDCRDNILCFDRQSGKFLHDIGQTGEAPGSFSTFTDLIYQEKEGMLYVKRGADKLQKYDLQGNYHGQITMPLVQGVSPTSIVVSDTTFVGHYFFAVLPKAEDPTLLFFSPDGTIRKEIRTQPPHHVEYDYEQFQTLIKTYGPMMLIQTNGYNGGVVDRVYRSLNLWNFDGQLRFREDFNDTIYTVAGDSLRPSYAFHTGQWHFPAEALTHGAGHEDKIIPACAWETPRKILFYCLRNLYGDNVEEFYGLYDKQDGTTRMAPRGDGLTDDLSGFMPFHPTYCSSTGEFAALVWPEDILPWLDEHPEARENPILKPLAKMDPEDNPVVIIVK